MMFSKFMDFADDGLNPIVVKEIRQSLNSRLVFSIMSLMLLLQLAAMLIIFAGSHGSEAIGETCFYFMLAAFCLGAFLGVGFKTGTKVAKERAHDSPDLIYASAVSPYKIIRGKLFSAFILVLLLMSMSAPFMAVSYFLGGIELPVILVWCFLALAAFVPLQLLIIFVGALNAGDQIKRAAWGGMTFAIIWLTISALAASRFSIDICSWKFIGLFTLGAAVSAGALYIASSAIISAPHSNRAAALRIYVFAVWLAGLLSAFAASLFYKSDTVFETWRTAAFIVMEVMMITSLAERDAQTRRVMRLLPRGRAGRIVFFIFSSGSASGVLFALGVVLASAFYGLLMYVFLAPSMPSRPLFNSDYIMAGALYFCAYALLALASKRVFRKIAPAKAGLCAFMLFVFLLIFVMVGPLILDSATCGGKELFSDRAWKFYILSPVCLGRDGRFMDGLMAAVIMLIIAFLAALPEIMTQLRQYFPKTPPAVDRKNSDAA